MSEIKVAVIVGSLSKNSINTRLAQALQQIGGERFEFEKIEIGDLPLYNRDLDANLPPAVQRVKAQIEMVDGFLFFSPEYNRSIPSALKNLLDWASRPYGQSSWQGKVAAVAGGSSGAIGTAVAQTHLRTILTHLDMILLPQPELYVRVTDELISPSGETTSPEFKQLLEKFMTRFADLVAKNRA